MLRKNIIPLVAIVGLLSSCHVSRDSRYFMTLSKDTTISAYVSPGLDSRIRKDDLLGINVSSLSSADDALYAAPPGAVDKAGYVIDTDGNIYFHRLGKIKAEGLTRKELALRIQEGLKPYLSDAIVSVIYLNHKVTVAGEVGSPRVLQLPEEQITIMDALVSCGDLKVNSLRNDLMVIRDSSDKRVVKHINLEDHSILNSPWFYLQPNDIVIVNPDYKKVEREEKRTRFQSNFVIITSAISLAIVIISRFL